MRAALDSGVLHSPAWDTATAVPSAPISAQQSLVRTLQRDLIPRLAHAHRPAPAQLGAQDVVSFTADLLAGCERALMVRLDDLRQRGLSVQALCLDLLAPAACHLGTLWNEDRCDFASVTIAVGQLQRLMRLLGMGRAPSQRDPGAGPQVLMLQPPQEQHSFGMAMVAEFFRCAGWVVSGGVVDGSTSAAACARARHLDVVGFSVGSEAQLDWLRREIASVRKASVNPRLVVMVGGPLFVLHPDRAAGLDVDLCLDSAREAPNLAERLLRTAA